LGSGKNNSMPMVRTTSGHFVPWDRGAITRSLLKETKLAKEFLGTPAITRRQAEEVALRVEDKIRRMELSFVSGALVREVVNNVLLEEPSNPNFRIYRNIMTRVGAPVYDAFQIDIGKGFESKENANLQPNAESLPPDEVVVIDIGCGFKRLPIGEVIDQLMNEHHEQVEIKSGSEFLRLNGDLKVLAFNEKLQVEPMPVTAAIRHRGKEVYKIKLENGREVKTSADHNLFTLRNGKLVALPLSDLEIGDCVAVPANIRSRYVISHLNIVERLIENCSDEDLKLLYIRSEEISTIIDRRRKEIGDILDKMYGKGLISRRHPSRREATRRIITLWKHKKTLPLLIWKHLYQGSEELPASACIGTWRTKKTHEFPAIIKLSHDLGLILGLMISEGWLGTRKISIETQLRSRSANTKVTFSNKDEQIIREFISAWKRVFRSTPMIQSSNCAKRIVLGTRPLSYLLEKGLEVKVATSRHKDIPTWMFKAPDECIAGFLRGIYLGDGNMTDASLSTTSKRLSDGVALLMLCLGIYPRMYRKKDGYENVVYVGGSSAQKLKELTGLPLSNQNDVEYADTIPGLETTLDMLWRSIRWKGWNGEVQKAVSMLSRWTSHTAPTRKSLNEFLEIVKANALQYDQTSLQILESFANSDIRFERIVKIEKAGFSESLYDFEVRPGDREIENFVGGSGFICLHNTAHKKKADKTAKEEYLLLMPMEQADAHLKGDIHIHDLEYFGTRPFCQNWDLRYFLYYGFMPDGLGFKTSVAGPAKRPEVAVLHSVKVLAAAQTNFAGGEGFYNYTLFLAPYMRGLNYEEIKQLMQMMFFELTQMYVARGGQPVFSNVQIMPSVPEIWADMPVVQNGKVGPDTYGSYQEEVRQLYRAINEVSLRGDHWGKPFNFPKLENGITPEMLRPENDEELLLAHKVVAKFGSPYFDNMIPEYRGYGKGVSCYQCCSYSFVETPETDEAFQEKMRFEGGEHFSMGSWQVVTINLPRAAYRAGGNDEKLFEELRKLMDLCVEVFKTKRRWMELMIRNHRMPFATQRPTDPSGGKKGPPAVDFEELAYTIGLVGANEMAQHHTGKQLHESDEAVKLAVRAVLEMKKYLKELKRGSKMKLALARTPAESCAQRLAVCDLLSEEFRNKARSTVKGDFDLARKMLRSGERDVPIYYSNGTHVYVGARLPLVERMRIENKFFPILDGGNMFHIWLGEGDPNPESMLEMTKKISTQTQIGYFAYTRDLTVCEDCNKVQGGVHRRCPSCGSKNVRWWSRVTGYYQDVGGWNRGKRQEFFQRFRTEIGHKPPAS